MLTAARNAIRLTAAPFLVRPHLGSFAPSRSIVCLLAALFACRAVAAMAIVPPWQGPDEPTHFALAKQFTRSDGRTADAIQGFEREILQSMARHHWWRHYERRTPEPIPVSFSQVPDDLFRGTLDQPIYYLLAAGVLRTIPGGSVEREYLALRALSIVLTVMTMIVGWMGTRALFGSATAAGVLAIITLHPQFLLSAITVNPDALVNFCGAVIWWQAARMVDADRGRRLAAVACIVAACLLAALTKRNGLPLTGVAVVIASIASGVTARRAGAVVFGLGAAVAGAVLAVVYAGDAYSAGMGRLVAYWGSAFQLDRLDVSPQRVSGFVTAAVDTAWLTAGWLRFPAPDLWAWIARVITLAGLAGAVAAIRNDPANKPLIIAAAFVAIHFGTLLIVAFLAGSVPQGRYLFAALFPAAVLIWTGLMHWLARRIQAWAPFAIVGLLATLDTTGFLFVLLPAYAR